MRRDRIANLAAAAAALFWTAPAVPASAASQPDPQCSTSLGGQTRDVAGAVTTVIDHWGLSMVIFDRATSCRISVAVDDTAQPCVIRQNVRIPPSRWIRAGQAELATYDYLLAGNGRFTCG